MRPEAMVLRRYADIGPGKRVQPRDVGYIADTVDGQQNWQYNQCHWYEYAKQELQVLEEEVAVDAGNANELAVADGEDIFK